MKKDFSIKLINVLIIIIITFCIPNLLNEFAVGNEIDYSIYYVDFTGQGDFLTIQEGIDFAQRGDTVIVRNGVYYENIVIDKSINLIGESINYTIIDGRNAGNVIKINSDTVIIINFTIQNSGIYFPNAGINVSSNNNSFENNLIIDNFYGLTLHNSSNNFIVNNVVKDNNNCGIFMSSSSYNIIINNILSNQFYNGIGLYDSSDRNSIKNNTFINNGYCGINIKISSNNLVSFNNFTNNNIGIHIPSLENEIGENFFYKNNIDVDEEILTPGFLFILFLISVFILYIFRKK